MGSMGSTGIAGLAWVLRAGFFPTGSGIAAGGGTAAGSGDEPGKNSGSDKKASSGSVASAAVGGGIKFVESLRSASAGPWFTAKGKTGEVNGASFGVWVGLGLKGLVRLAAAGDFPRLAAAGALPVEVLPSGGFLPGALWACGARAACITRSKSPPAAEGSAAPSREPSKAPPRAGGVAGNQASTAGISSEVIGGWHGQDVLDPLGERGGAFRRHAAEFAHRVENRAGDVRLERI